MTETPSLAVTKSFTDDKGNRFIFPSWIIYPEDEAQDTNPTKYNLILDAMMLSLSVGVTTDDDWFEFDHKNFPHLKTDIYSRNFAHGGATVLLFAGPEFDKAMSEQDNVRS